MAINNTVKGILPPPNSTYTPTATQFSNNTQAPNITSVSGTRGTTAYSGAPYLAPNTPLAPTVNNLNNKTSTPSMAGYMKPNAPLGSIQSSSSTYTNPYTAPSISGIGAPYVNGSQAGSQTGQSTQNTNTQNGGYANVTNAANTTSQQNLNDPGAFTYSGGVNSYGDKLAGYTGGASGGAQTSQQNVPSNSYAGLVSRIAEQSSKPSDSYLNAQKSALDYQEQLNRLKQSQAEGIKNIQNSGTPMSQALGEAGAINSLYAAREGALASAFQGAASLMPSATSQQSSQIQGLTGAAGLAAPIQVPYSNQLVNPLSVQDGGGAGGSLQNAVNNVVQKLSNGEMTYNDALSALSGYGQGGVNALQQALPAGFNIAQSNTLAGQQGSIGVNYQLADTALKNVESIMQQLGGAQTTNIPSINKVANWISTQFGIGSEQTRAMTGAVQSLRNAYASLLASSKGGTPTDYSGQAQAEIPDEPTPNDLVAIRHNFETLGKARANILGNPGQSGSTQSNESSATNFNW